jgi:hypothetical protein
VPKLQKMRQAEVINQVLVILSSHLATKSRAQLDPPQTLVDIASLKGEDGRADWSNGEESRYHQHVIVSLVDRCSFSPWLQTTAMPFSSHLTDSGTQRT